MECINQNMSSPVYDDQSKARNCGRDAACLFRSHSGRDILKAVSLASRLLNTDCPPRLRRLAASEFNANVCDGALAKVEEDCEPNQIVVMLTRVTRVR